MNEILVMFGSYKLSFPCFSKGLGEIARAVLGIPVLTCADGSAPRIGVLNQTLSVFNVHANTVSYSLLFQLEI